MSKGPPRFLLLKAQPIPAGARWITVTPPGHEKGQPVLVQPHPTHKGVWSVIGGAGGKLNYLKLRGIKPEGSYKSDLAEKDKARRELAKQQAARDKELGIAKPKAVRKAEIAAQRQQHQREFIATVAAAAGWRKEQTEFKAEDHAHLSPEAYQAVQRQHHASLLKKAKAFVAQQRAELLADADKKAEAFGAVPLTAPKDRPEALTVNDLDPVKAPDAGIGLSHDYAERAVEKAGGADDLKAEVDALREPKAGGGGDKRREMAEQIKRELAELKIPDTPLPDPKSLDTRQTLGLLAAEKRLRQAERAMSKAMAAIDKAEDIKEIQAYNVEVGEPPDDASVIRDLQDIARTEQTVSFLKMAEEAGEGIPPEQALYRHIAAGASNALSAAGLTIAGQALVDRSVVDVLGIAGAAQVAARQLHATLTPDELETVKSALDDYHVDHYSRTAREAMDRAQVWLEAADKAQGMDATAEDGDDLALIENLNRQRIDALAEARKILGTALGEFEMGAALNMAMREGRSNKPFEVSLGKINPASAYTQLRALGLEPGDFHVNAIGGEQIAEITPDGLDKISRSIDRKALQRQRAALDIIEGRQDEKDWLPEGFAARKDLNGIAEPGQAPKLAEPFDASKGLEQGIKDYFGGRVADGDNPRDILADATNSQWMDTHIPTNRREAYLSALAALLPSTRTRKAMAEGTGGEGKLVTEKVPIENHRDILEAWADEFVKSRYGETRTAFDRQDIPIDDISTEAMHRALAAHPEGVAAFKTIGDLTDKDQRALRTHFEKHVAKDSDEATALKKEIAELKDAEPGKETVDMFGDTATNPEWTVWSQKMAAKREKLGAESLTWDKYVTVMDGRERAYAAVQDLIRSKIAETFHAAYNTLRPDAPLKLGRQNIRDHRRHLDAIDPKARKERLTAQSSEDAAMRFRRGGKFAEGGIKDEREEQRTAKEGFQQAQIGMFGEPEDTAPVPLGAHERHSLGHVTEQRLAGLANTIGGQFKTGQPVELRAVSMTDRYINQQRAIKLIAANKRVALAMSTGSGKTSIGLGAFAHLHAKGEVKRGIFAVPSVVQEQFNAEALRTLDPTKGFKWHATPGADREARIAALKDPGNHFVVMTHQSLRDDLLHLGAQHEGIDTTALAAKLDAMTPAERKAWMGDLLKREGIDAQYLNVDEGHNLLNRAGKENSHMANVFDALSANVPYYVNATADPVKNDVSEAFDLMRKMNPDKYADRAEFMRRYGPNTPAARDALRREMLQHLYPGRIDPGVAAKRTQEKVALSDEQKATIGSIESTAAKIRLARMRGKTDIENARTLAPEMFDGADPKEHERIAREIARYVGVLKNTATLKAINTGPNSAKLDRVAQLAKARQGKPGVVFAHNLESVKRIKERLEKDGHRVAVLTGADGAKKKGQIKSAFNPEGDIDATADILIASDAGATGLNAQRGQWLVQYDVPETAMLHAQRNGRIHRLGQKNNVELIDLMTDHPTEQAARKRLAGKYELREILTSPYEGLDDTGLASFLHRRKVNDEEQQGGLF